jgi:NAD+ kinase
VSVPTRIGVVTHPTRDVDAPLREVLAWAEPRAVEVVQIPFHGERRLPRDGRAEDCDLVLAIGGDGTTLAAIHRAAGAGRPVLGVACGSLGALTSVEAAAVSDALECFAAADWLPRPLPGLRVGVVGRPDRLVFNDVVVVRAGPGQLRLAVRVDGALYARLAGDGCVITTPAGSSAYTIAAGGPLIAPELAAYAVTPLPTHGGFHPPLVLDGRSLLELEISTSHGGGRLELDGDVTDGVPGALTVGFEASAATVVAFSDEESHLAGLRRRGILSDSPRILADDARR